MGGSGHAGGDGRGGGGRQPPAGGGGGLRQAGIRPGGGQSGHAAHRRVRRQQRHPHAPRRGRRHRGPGLVPDALPHVYPLGGAPQLHRQDPGL